MGCKRIQNITPSYYCKRCSVKIKRGNSRKSISNFYLYDYNTEFHKPFPLHTYPRNEIQVFGKIKYLSNK